MQTGLLPPFNDIARAAAGMGIEMYQPLSVPTKQPIKNTQKRNFHSSTSRNYSSTSTLNQKRVMFLSTQWPEFRRTAAGVRTSALIDFFIKDKWEVFYASTSRYIFF